MNLNLLSRVTVMRKSSIRARPSPRHIRGPETWDTFNQHVMYVIKKKNWRQNIRGGFFGCHTRRERHERFWFNELPLVVEEVVRVELTGGFPLSLLVQHRVQILDDQRALRRKVTQEGAFVSCCSMHFPRGWNIYTSDALRKKQYIFLSQKCFITE